MRHITVCKQGPGMALQVEKPLVCMCQAFSHLLGRWACERNEASSTQVIVVIVVQ